MTIKNITESALWLRLRHDHEAKYGKGRIWRIDNRHGTGISDVYCCLPGAAWYELKSAHMLNDYTMTIHHPLSAMQADFLRKAGVSAHWAVLIGMPGGMMVLNRKDQLTAIVCRRRVQLINIEPVLMVWREDFGDWFLRTRP